jgi:hypothetical protein
MSVTTNGDASRAPASRATLAPSRLGGIALADRRAAAAMSVGVAAMYLAVCAVHRLVLRPQLS